MAEVGTIVFNSERLCTNGLSPLGDPVDFDVKGLGRRLPRTDAPEGWIKKGRTSPPRQNMGRVLSSLGDGHEWSADSPEEGKNTRTCIDTEARGTTEAGRVHRGLYRPDHETRLRDHDVCRSVERLLRCEIGPMGKENEGRSPVPFCETRYTGRRKPAAPPEQRYMGPSPPHGAASATGLTLAIMPTQGSSSSGSLSTGPTNIRLIGFGQFQNSSRKLLIRHSMTISNPVAAPPSSRRICVNPVVGAYYFRFPARRSELWVSMCTIYTTILRDSKSKPCPQRVYSYSMWPLTLTLSKTASSRCSPKVKPWCSIASGGQPSWMASSAEPPVRCSTE